MYISSSVLMLGIAFVIGLIIAYKAACGLLSSFSGGGFMPHYPIRAPLQDGAVHGSSPLVSLSTVLLIVGIIALIAFSWGEEKGNSSPKQDSPPIQAPRVNVSPSGTTNNKIRLLRNSEEDRNVLSMTNVNQEDLITKEIEVDTTSLPIRDNNIEQEIPAIEYTDYFIQIYSVGDSISAFNIAHDYKEKLDLNHIYVGIVGDASYSMAFKVLIGSYPNIQDAKSYTKQNRRNLPENSWPRKAHTLGKLYVF